MLQKHTLNERLKRLEPIDTKCCYCSVANSTRMNDNYFVPVFKVQDRTNIIVYSSVKFSKLLIGIPRCASCKEIHQSAVRKANVIAIISAIVVLVLCSMIWGFFGGVAGVFLGCLTGFGGSFFLTKKFVSDQGVLNLKEGAEQDETVQDFIIAGWSFTHPSA
jgi:hypothetical protein